MNRLKALRKEQNRSQDELAKLLNVSSMTISRWENAEQLSLKIEKAQKLAEYFGVSVGYLLGYGEEVYNTLQQALEPISKVFEEKKQYQNNLEQFALNNDLRNKMNSLVNSDLHLEYIQDLNDLRSMIETRFNNKLLTESERETLEQRNLELLAFIDELYRFRLFVENLPNE